jgi:hypothetical protein
MNTKLEKKSMNSYIITCDVMKSNGLIKHGIHVAVSATSYADAVIRLTREKIRSDQDVLLRIYGPTSHLGPEESLWPQNPDETRNDFIINPVDGDSLWLTLGNLSIYIRATWEGAVVDFYPLNREMSEPLATQAFMFAEIAEEYQEE